jgi:FKBP-type peptidyl-prolyl cis-trans isomerase FkpA
MKPIQHLIRTFAISLSLGLSLTLWSGCQDEVAEQFEADKQEIADYVAANDLDGEYTDEGIFISFEQEGIGSETPDLSSEVEAIYKGYLLNGTVFDDSEGFPVSFPLRGVIQGWQIALQRFKRDAKGTIIIPSRYGYGQRTTGNIPPNSVLVFDIELVDFE